MAERASFGQISDDDFASLFEALSATGKGCAFLAELRRRARPQETEDLLGALDRIERTMAGVRDQLQPERLGDELRHISMTLEIATEGMPADADGDEPARRMALVNRARAELDALAASLAGEIAPAPEIGGASGVEATGDAPDPIGDDLAFLDQLEAAGELPVER
jgi:hypothetical protein